MTLQDDEVRAALEAARDVVDALSTDTLAAVFRSVFRGVGTVNEVRTPDALVVLRGCLSRLEASGYFALEQREATT